MTDYEFGQKLILSPEQLEILKPHIDRFDDAEAAFDRAARLLRISKRNFLDILLLLYPDLKHYNFSFLPSHTIIVEDKRQAKE